MDLDATPIFNCCKQYKTNDNVFELIDIADDLRDIDSLINASEMEAVNSESQYNFEFFMELYYHSFERFLSDDMRRYKYNLRYILYAVQIDKVSNKPFFRLKYTPFAKSMKFVASYAFYSLIWYSMKDSIEFMEPVTEEGETIVKYLKRGLFNEIISLMDDIWYMPAIKNPPCDEMKKLEAIHKLPKDLDHKAYNDSIKAILGTDILNAFDVEPDCEVVSNNFSSPLGDTVVPNIHNSINGYCNTNSESISNTLSLPEHLSPEKPQYTTVMTSENFRTPIQPVRHIAKCGLKRKIIEPPIKFPQPVESCDTHKYISYASPSPAAKSRNTCNESTCTSLSDTSVTSSNDHNKAFIISSCDESVAEDASITVRENPILCSPYSRKIKETVPMITPHDKYVEAINGTLNTEDYLNQSAVCIDMSFSIKPTLPTFGPYKCDSLIGSGSFSKVYEAHKEGDKTKYALKVLRFDETQSQNAVMNELLIMEKMNATGKSIFLIERFISERGAIIVMEKALTDMKNFYTNNRNVADKYFVLHYWRSMIKCVEAMHELKIVHLDLKLQNFVVTEDLWVKLIDFGISRSSAGKTMKVEEGVGTVVYMSPELMRNEKQIMPYKCDIWSMGIVLYYMVFDNIPVHVETQEEYMQEMLKEDFAFPNPPCDRNCPLLANLMYYCLQKDPRKRKEAHELLELMDENECHQCESLDVTLNKS